jgi:hypothetical protein
MTNQMHPAKALQTAVHAVSSATYIPANIRGTDIQVSYKLGRYYIFNGATQYNRFDRDEAIELVQQLCIEGRK